LKSTETLVDYVAYAAIVQISAISAR